MEQRIKEIMKKEFDANVLEIKKMTRGYSHHVYEVMLDKSPNIAVIRFSNNSRKEFNLEKEKFVIELLRNKNIPAPKIYASDKDYLIMEKFQGLSLDILWDSLSKEDKIKISQEIGKTLKKMHEIKFEDFGYIDGDGKIISHEKGFEFKNSGEKREYNKFLRVFFADLFSELSKFLSYDKISKDFSSRFLDYIIQNLEKIAFSSKPVLIHGDFTPCHIFVKKSGEDYKITGLIDFEHAQAYPPEYDFIKLHRAGFFEDLEIKNALTESYGNIDEELVEVFRIIRDFQFAVILSESGDIKKADKILKEIETKIDQR